MLGEKTEHMSHIFVTISPQFLLNRANQFGQTRAGCRIKRLNVTRFLRNDMINYLIAVA